MPTDVDQALRSGGFLRTSGPHAPATVGRRLANWSTLTKWRGLDGVFASPAPKSAIRPGVRAVPRTRRRKNAKVVTSDVLAKLLAICGGNSLRDLRDRTILMVAFALWRPAALRFSGHGLRSGDLTEAANRGIPLPRGDGTVKEPLCTASLKLL